jgi:hypothetical protein
MAFKNSTGKSTVTKYGEPYLYGSADVTTSTLNTSDAQFWLGYIGLSLDGVLQNLAISKTGILINESGGPKIAFKDSNSNINNYTLNAISNSYSFGVPTAINDKYFFMTVKNTTYSSLTNTVSMYIHNDTSGNRSALALTYNLTPPTIKTSSPNAGEIKDIAVYKDKLIIYHLSNNNNAYIYTTPLTVSTAPNENNNKEVENTSFVHQNFRNIQDKMCVGNDRIVVSNGYATGAATYSFSIYDLELNLIKSVSLPTNLPGMSENGPINEDTNATKQISIGCGRIVISDPAWGKGAYAGGTGDTQGYVLVYDLNGNLMWYKKGSSNTQFGSSTVVTNGRVYISAVQESPSNLFYAGAIYEYDLDGNFIHKIESNTNLDYFGQHMKSDGNILLMSKGNEVTYIRLDPKIHTAYDKIYNEV